LADDVMKTYLEPTIPILVGFLPIFERFFPILIRLFPLFDRLLLFLASHFLQRILKAWKNQGLIDNYGTKITRTAKLHYKVDIRIILTTEQAKIMLNDLISKVSKRLQVSS